MHAGDIEKFKTDIKEHLNNSSKTSAEIKEHLETQNKLLLVNTVVGAISAVQRRKTNQLLGQLVVTSEGTLKSLEDISKTQNLILDEIKKIASAGIEGEKKQKFENGIRQIAFELISDLAKIDKLNSNLEKYFRAKQISEIPAYDMLSKTIPYVNTIEEKLRIDEAIGKLNSFIKLDVITLTKKEDADLENLYSLIKERERITKVRDIGQRYRKDIRAMKKQIEANNPFNILTVAYMSVMLKRFNYWQGMIVLVIAFISSSSIFYYLGAIIFIVRFLEGLLGIRRKAIIRAEEIHKINVEDQRNSGEEVQIKRCDKELDKFKKIYGKTLTYENYSEFTRLQNFQLTKKFKNILKVYPSLKISASKA